MKYIVERAYIILDEENNVVDWYPDEDDANEFLENLMEVENE